MYGNWNFFFHLGILLGKMHSLYDDILSVFNGTVFGCVGRDAFCWTVVSSLAIVINDRTNSIRDTIYGSRTIWQGFIKSLPKKWSRRSQRDKKDYFVVCFTIIVFPIQKFKSIFVIFQMHQCIILYPHTPNTNININFLFARRSSIYFLFITF